MSDTTWVQPTSDEWTALTPEQRQDVINRVCIEHLPVSCVCTNACGEGDEAGCLDCTLRDIYEPCPAVGFACGVGNPPGTPKTRDDCCTEQQWKRATGELIGVGPTADFEDGSDV